MTIAASAPRSTADARRAAVVRHAVSVFARSGYWATPITDVAQAAKISPAYVFRLFDSKLGLFVAALDHCFTRIIEALDAGVDRAPDGDPATVLAFMGDAYARLIADRDLLMLQVHALSAVDVPEIAEAMRQGAARVVTFAQQRSGAPDAAVQEFIAYGQLCHLIVAIGLDGRPEPWSRLLTANMSHPDRVGGDT